MVSFGPGGGGDGGIWDRVDDLTDQLYDVEKKRGDESGGGAFVWGRAGEAGVGRAFAIGLGCHGRVGGWSGWGKSEARVFDAWIEASGAGDFTSGEARGGRVEVSAFRGEELRVGDNFLCGRGGSFRQKKLVSGGGSGGDGGGSGVGHGFLFFNNLLEGRIQAI